MNQKLKCYIYKIPKSSMQSGTAPSKLWMLEFKLSQHHYFEPVMNWMGSNDMQSELKLKFISLQEAVSYAQAKDWQFTLLSENQRHHVPKSYSDNFKIFS